MNLRFWREGLALKHTWTIARGSSIRDDVILVELRDTDGVFGVGEAAPSRRYGEDVRTVERFLNEINPNRLSFSDIPGSLEYLSSLAPGNSAAKGALDIALMDGAGRRQHKAVYDLFGLGFREGAHQTSFSIGIDSPERISAKVAEAAEYPILKIKLGVQGDKENLAAVRAVAPKKRLRVDANEGWRTKEEALAMLEWLAAEHQVEFCEQPLPATAPAEDFEWLKARSPVPLMADESFVSAADVPHCARCFHSINVKLVKTGGINPAVLALKAARSAGLKTMLGCMIETSVLISAAAHLAELADYLDLDGNLLISNDPFAGVTAERGNVSFLKSPEPYGLRVARRNAVRSGAQQEATVDLATSVK